MTWTKKYIKNLSSHLFSLKRRKANVPRLLYFAGKEEHLHAFALPKLWESCYRDISETVD